MVSKPWKHFQKTIQAPRYFREAREMISHAEKIVSEKLGVSLQWLQAQSGKDPKVFSQIISEYAEKMSWTEHDKRKVKLLLGSTSLFIEYAWARFMIDHMDDLWGRAEPDTLFYDERNDEVRMKWFMPTIKRPFRKLKKRFSRKRKRKK